MLSDETRDLGFVGALAVGLSLVACNYSPRVAPEEPAARSIAQAATASAVPSMVSMDVTYPAGFAMSTVAVGDGNSLQIGDRTKIYGVGGAKPGAATNSGSGALSLGNDTTVGILASDGSIRVSDRAHATSLLAAGAVTLGNQDVIGGETSGAILTPLVHRTTSCRPRAQLRP